MQETIHRYIRTCQKCQIMNLQKPNYINLHQDIVQILQDHISINLIGPCNVTSQDNTYVLTAVCNLTGNLMTTPIPDKKTTVAIHLFFENNTQIWFAKNITFRQWNRSLNSLKILHKTRYKENLHIPLTSPNQQKIRIIT